MIFDTFFYVHNSINKLYIQHKKFNFNLKKLLKYSNKHFLNCGYMECVLHFGYFWREFKNKIYKIFFQQNIFA